MLSKTIAEILNGDDPWHYATFEGAVQLQLKIDARTPLTEKLEWLEQAGRLAQRLERQANVQDRVLQPTEAAAAASDVSRVAEAAQEAKL